MLPAPTHLTLRFHAAILGGDGHDNNRRHDDSTLKSRRDYSELPPAFVPTASNPLHAHLEDLAAAPSRQALLEDAPPDFRLSAVSYRIASLEKQLREQVRTFLFFFQFGVLLLPGEYVMND